jgi:rfaE bifunctional protein kinase chain/domain
MQNKTNKKKVLVVGDLMLDESIFGSASRLTPEGPVPVILKEKTEATLGGAGFVARILADLGIDVTLVGVIGMDNASSIVMGCCKEDGINSSQIMHADNFKTSRKTRIYASGHLVARLDEEDRFIMTDACRESLLKSLSKLLKDQDYKVCIISDYDKGFCDDDFIKKLITICNENNIATLVDPKTKDVNKFSGAHLIKPNDNEAAKILDISMNELPCPEDVVKKISQLLNIPNILYTRGSKGMVLFSDNQMLNIKAIQQEVFNVVGAGDTVIAGLCAGLINDLSIKESSLLANDLAGEMVSKLSRKIKPSNSIKNKLSI